MLQGRTVKPNATALGHGLSLIGLVLPLLVQGQATEVRVVTEAGAPVSYATVWVNSGRPRIADIAGRVSFPSELRAGASIEVRRMGFAPAELRLGPADTSALVFVKVRSLAARLDATTITADAGGPKTLALKGFYERALDRERGAGSGLFIGPEEIEKRDPHQTTDLLRGANGVTLMNAPGYGLVATNPGGTCQMTVIVDGTRVRSKVENRGGGTTGGMLSAGPRESGPRGARVVSGSGGSIFADSNAVFIDRLVDPSNVTAVEVYTRGGNIPMSMQQTDQGCGVIAIWTGARK
jgi:hypothetical protein